LSEDRQLLQNFIFAFGLSLCALRQQFSAAFPVVHVPNLLSKNN
jgi:hypothetical protein